ncbi:MAG: hypothetical protein PHH28_14480 [Desulfuromonadaceae bacterium]|nr:hypothetical protein [Desulfuromonadaceae bacterium]
MKLLSNQKGIALITSLMLTLITLTIVMYLLYMITAGTKMSGANKRYKTVLEASYGSTDLVLKEMIPIMFSGLTTPGATLSASGFSSLLNLSHSSDACLNQKLTLPSSKWDAACSSSPDATVGADITLRLNSTSSDQFTIYTKIVETICSDPRPYPEGSCTGSDLSGIEGLDAGASVSGGIMGVVVQHLPATYRIEVQGERGNTQERAKLSILYAY